MTFKEYIIKREKEYTGSISNPDDLIEINDAEEYHKDYLEIVKDDFLHSVMPRFDVEKLETTMVGRNVLNAIALPIANRFNTHPEKVRDLVKEIVIALNRIEA